MLLTIITSSLIAAVVSVGASYIFRFIDFRNDYYKEVIKRRMDVYAQIEDMLQNLSKYTPSQECHSIFLQGYDHFLDFKISVTGLVTRKIWIGSDTYSQLQKLERILVEELTNPDFEDSYSRGDKSEMSQKLKEAGRRRYTETSQIVHDLLDSISKDFLELHNIKPFLKTKK